MDIDMFLLILSCPKGSPVHDSLYLWGRSGRGRVTQLHLQLLPSLCACDRDLTPLRTVALRFVQTEVLL